MNTISELLFSSFEKFKEKNAIIDNGILTFDQLMHNASCIASALERQGLKQGDLVSIYLKRSKEYITSVVACLLYGYGVVLLDIEYPEDRIDYIIKDSSSKLVLDSDFFDKSVSENIEAQRHEIRPDTSALVVYTSGSTGNPKGVLHDQESVYNGISRFRNMLNVTSDDVFGSTAPYSFVAISIDVLYPLSEGACVDVIPRSIVKDAEILSEYINSHNITVSQIAPKILRVFKKTGNSLRTAYTGSEKVSNIFPDDFTVYNLYGMSEGFPSVCIFKIDRPYDVTPVGKCDGSLGIYLLDDDGNEAEEGEICVSGHLFSKYINLPEQTAKVLCPNPFYDIDGHEMLFHTNDMGKRLPDGSIQYVNRKDWMIKINGFRVEPGEIETNIKAIPQIFDAVVKGFVRENGSPYLAAYYVEKEPIEVDQIRRILSKVFPYYMVPSYFVRLEALPVNNNGKLDHKALKEPETANMAVSYVAPTSELEELLCNEMASVLSVKKVGINDNFFMLGGNYEEVIDLAEKFSDYGLNEKVIYEYKTPKNIASAISNVSSSNIEEKNELALSIGQKLTPAQQYYLDCQLYAPSSTNVNIPMELVVSKELIDVAQLKSVLENNFTLHPVLNSTISFNEVGDLVQNYTEGSIASVECHECTESEFVSEIRKKWTKKFRPLNGLLYYCLLYTTEEKHHILFDIHKCICDDIGVLTFFRGVLDSVIGKESADKDYYYAYLSNASNRDEKFLSMDIIKQIQDVLSDSSFSYTPRMDNESCEITSAYIYKSFSRSNDEYLNAISAHRSSINNLLIAAALLALGKYNDSNNVALNWLYGGRDEPWEKSAMGLMSSAIQISASISNYTSLIDLIKSINKQINFGVEFSDNLTFLGTNPGIKDLLQIQYIGYEDINFDAFENAAIFFENNNVNQFHVLAIKQKPEDPMTFRFSYNSSCYTRESVEKFADLFIKAFDACCFGTLKDWQAN